MVRDKNKIVYKYKNMRPPFNSEIITERWRAKNALLCEFEWLKKPRNLESNAKGTSLSTRVNIMDHIFNL